MSKETEVNVPKVIIIYELILGLVEIISALGILFLGKSLLGIYENLKKAELFEDPNDLVVRLTEKLIPNLFVHHIYIALLLLAFGIIKIASGVGLIYKKIWAEHLLIIFLIILIPFEIIGILKHFSLPDLAYLVINAAIVLYLIRFKPVEYLHRLINDLKPKK